MDLETRIAELRLMAWQDIKSAADAAGVEKLDDATWKDMAENIAIAESIQMESDTSPGTQTTQTKEDYSQSFYSMAGITYCVNCGSKRCTDDYGVVIRCCDNQEFSDDIATQ